MGLNFPRRFGLSVFRWHVSAVLSKEFRLQDLKITDSRVIIARHQDIQHGINTLCYSLCINSRHNLTPRREKLIFSMMQKLGSKEKGKNTITKLLKRK